MILIGHIDTLQNTIPFIAPKCAEPNQDNFKVTFRTSIL